MLARQGRHQVAQKSRTTGRPLRSLKRTHLPSKVLSEKAGAGAGSSSAVAAEVRKPMHAATNSARPVRILWNTSRSVSPTPRSAASGRPHAVYRPRGPRATSEQLFLHGV